MRDNPIHQDELQGIEIKRIVSSRVKFPKMILYDLKIVAKNSKNEGKNRKDVVIFRDMHSHSGEWERGKKLSIFFLLNYLVLRSRNPRSPMR